MASTIIHTCELCSFKSRFSHNYDSHVLTKKHIENVMTSATTGSLITCPICTTYKSADKSNFKRHVHKCKLRKCPEPVLHACPSCNVEYFTRSGLYKHRKKCQAPIPAATSAILPIQKPLGQSVPTAISVPDLQTIVALTVSEVIKNHPTVIHNITNHNGNTTNTTHNTNTTNITNTVTKNEANFNLNVFLNEKCKDAMNIMDFARGIQLQLKDIEHIGNVGYVTGMGDVISTALQELDITERPLHCTDTKREVIHVKHENKWHKEEPGCPILLQAVQLVGRRSNALTAAWRDAHPLVQSSEDITETIMYHKIQLQVTGGLKAHDPAVYQMRNRKIMKRICQTAKLTRAIALTL
jgi:hypothetical protein